MTKEDLIMGETYYVLQNGINDLVFVPRKCAEEGLCYVSSVMYQANRSSNFFCDTLSSYLSSGLENDTLRLATYKEKEWLRTCITAHKWVECPKITTEDYSLTF